MAKIEGTQNIPSELKYLYDGALTPLMPDGVVRGRYPWRIPKMQTGGSGVSALQKEQRQRWLTIRDKFKNIDEATRQRWYAARPQWNSFLWYYNYFMMSGLMGNAVVGDKGGAVIKTIQTMKGTCPVSGTKVFTLPVAITGAKTISMLQGSARKVPRVLRGSGTVEVNGSTLNLGATVDPAKCTIKLFGTTLYEGGGGTFSPNYPYVFALSATQISIKWSLDTMVSADISWEITEHVEGAVHPVLLSISNTQVTVDWAEVPDTAAEVSITAIEYI